MKDLGPEGNRRRAGLTSRMLEHAKDVACSPCVENMLGIEGFEGTEVKSTYRYDDRKVEVKIVVSVKGLD